DHTLLEAMEGDVPAILRDRRAHAGIEQFLDLRRDLVVFRVIRVPTVNHGGQERLPGDEVLHDDAEDARLEQEPFPLLILGHRNEIIAEEDPGYALHLEKPTGEWRTLCLLRRRKAGGAFGHHRPPGQKLEGCRVGCLLGLNEHEGLQWSRKVFLPGRWARIEASSSPTRR